MGYIWVSWVEYWGRNVWGRFGEGSWGVRDWGIRRKWILGLKGEEIC